MKEAHLKILGKVQGVWYRKSAKEKALDLGMTGFVRNLPDGSVEIVAQAKKETLDSFIAWCFQGPELSNVTNIEVNFREISRVFKDFEVLP